MPSTASCATVCSPDRAGREEPGEGGRPRVPRVRWILGSLLAVSAVLRLCLVLGGGAGYWPDEDRYQASREAAGFLQSGKLGSAWRALDGADHFLFKVIAVVPASVEHAFPSLAAIPFSLPAACLCLVSVFNILLVWKLVLRLGGEEREALFAAALLACTATFFYYSRHLLPYDLAMGFGLLAILRAVKSAPAALDSCLCGLLAGACFLTYGGYWSAGLVALLLHAVWERPAWRVVLKRVFVAGVCAAAPFYALATFSALRGGNLLGEFVRFSETVTQGSFAEGGTLPWEYLWHSEHGLLVLWVAGILGSVWLFLEDRACRRIKVALACLLVLYGLLVLNSVALHKFVVYGRLARQLTPFLCILTAACLHRVLKGRGALRLAAWPVLALVLVQAAVNFQVPLAQEFPESFRRKAEAARAGAEGRRTELWYAGHFYLDGIDPMAIPDASLPHEIVLEAGHPLQFLPYQYEGYDPKERQGLRESDIRMRLVILPDEEASRRDRVEHP